MALMAGECSQTSASRSSWPEEAAIETATEEAEAAGHHPATSASAAATPVTGKDHFNFIGGGEWWWMSVETRWSANMMVIRE